MNLENRQYVIRSLKMASLALVSAVALTSCGKGAGGLVTSVTGSASTQSNGEIIATVSAQLNTATYSIASFSLPIIDPSNSSIKYGSISLEPNAVGGGGALVISVNVSQAAHINSSVATTLPNGTAFPLATPSGDALVAIPIGNGGAKLYLMMGPQVLMIGTAIPFSALNGVGQYVPGVDVFSSVNFGNINSFIGVFAGSGNNQTGLGVFADLSKILPKPSASPAPAAAAKAVIAAQIQGVAGSSQASTSSAQVIASAPAPISLKSSAIGTQRQQNKLMNHLYQNSEDNPVLEYQ